MKEIKRIFYNSCVYFTVAEFAILLIAELMMKGGQKSDAVMGFLTLGGSVLLYAAALVLALLGGILRIKKLSGVVRWTLHCILSFIGMFLLFVVIPGNLKASFVVVFAVMFTLVYVILAFGCTGVGKFFSSRKKSDDYTPMFDEAKKK